MEHRYKVTTHGRAVLAACMDLQRPPVITRAAVGSGLISEGEDLADRHELIQYVSEAAIADRRHEGDRLFLTVQYANGEHRSVGAFVLSEFMVFCQDPETGQETDLLYGTLGDYRQPVPGYSDGYPASVWNYPIIMAFSSALDLHIQTSPGLVTWEDLLGLKAEIFRSIMMNELTLPLTTDSGELLLASDGTPILTSYRPDRSASILAAMEALEGRLTGQIAAAKAEAVSAAGAAADAKIAAHDTAAASHPSHLSIVQKS